MNIAVFLMDWIAAGNLYQTERYLNCFLEDAILDDPSVGSTFIGQEGILEYFNSYFIGYQTQTRLIDVNVKDSNHAFVIVEFTGDFPQKRLRGTFDMYFEHGKISKLTADLIL